MFSGGMWGNENRFITTGDWSPRRAEPPQDLFDYFSELEEIIRNPVMLPRQHSSLEKKPKMPWEQKESDADTFWSPGVPLLAQAALNLLLGGEFESREAEGQSGRIH